MVPVAGVEPARVFSPTDFESASSANSNTPAFDFLSGTGQWKKTGAARTKRKMEPPLYERVELVDGFEPPTC